MNEDFLIRAFVLYHEEAYTDKSGVTIIYIGTDKAKAFDALIAFLKNNGTDQGDIKVEYSKEGQE